MLETEKRGRAATKENAPATVTATGTINRQANSIRKKSKVEKVLDALLKGGSITSMDAFRWFNVTRLSAIIFALRARGYQIAAEPDIDADGKATKYVRYRLISG